MAIENDKGGRVHRWIAVVHRQLAVETAADARENFPRIVSTSVLGLTKC